MASFSDMQTTVDLATLYFQELTEELREDLINGCDCECGNKLICLQSAIYAIQYDISTEVNTPLTVRTYNLLQSLISGFSGAFNPDPNVVIPGVTFVIEAGDIMQTSVVFPTEGEVSYTFSELIGTEVLSVYRGTGTVLRAHTSAPTNEFAQVDTATGEITVSYAFSDGESLWVEYKTT